MICPNCGKDNTGNTKWCCYCGALLEQAKIRSAHTEADAAPETQVQRAQARQAPRDTPQNTDRKGKHPTPERKPPRRKKGLQVFLWLIAAIVLLVSGFIACLVFLPGISDAVLEMFPLRPADKTQTAKVPAAVDTAGTNGEQIDIYASDPGYLAPNEGASGSYANNGDLSPVQASEVGQAADQRWSDAYRAYVFEQNVVYEDYGPSVIDEKTFVIDNLQYYKGSYYEPRFGLYDLDRDGIPELIIFNGSSAMAGATDYVFTFTQGQVRYTGKVGFRGCELYAVDDAAYPGLFCSDGNNGIVRTIYYILQNGVINATELSRPGGSTWALPFYTIDEIRAMGWEEFVRLALSGKTAAASDPTPQQPAAEQEGTVIPIEPGVQYSANIFLSNFSEQHAFERTGFDADHYDAKQLVGFAYLYCKINRHTALSVENVWQPSLYRERSFYTITLDTINDILSRHFGITLRDDELRQQSWSDQYYYADGKYYCIAADGESYNRLTVVRQIEQLADGNFRLYFDIYRESIYLYQQANGAVDSSYYYLTSSAADADQNFTREASGTAIVRPYIHDGIPTMQLIRYTID